MLYIETFAPRKSTRRMKTELVPCSSRANSHPTKASTKGARKKLLQPMNHKVQSYDLEDTLLIGDESTFHLIVVHKTETLHFKPK